MIIGVPRERKTLEKRVALTPDGAAEITKSGHTVLVETKAGEGSFFEDKSYAEAGCRIVSSLDEVWEQCDLLVKVKEPDSSEFKFFRPNLTIFDYLHLASSPEVTHAMVEGKVTGIAYELVKDKDGRLPLLEPMSEVAGKLAVINGSYFLLSQHGGRGVLLGGAVGVERANVTIIGAGIAGGAACDMALGMGANVTVLDVSHDKLEFIAHRFANRARTLYSTKASLARELTKTDLLIGAVLIPGAAAPKLVNRTLVKTMPKGSVIIDISIDQGGCVETVRTTSLQTPTFEEEGVIHYGVPNMPAQTPRTSTLALTAVTLPYILQLAKHGIENCLKNHEGLRNALNTRGGKLTNQPVSEAVGIPFTPIEAVV